MLDADSADFRVMQNAYINLKDFRFGPTSDKGFAQQLEAVGGTALITNSLPAGTNYCIGVAQDLPNRRVIFFNWNSNGSHGIYCYTYVTNTIQAVLLNSQNPGLGFDRLHLIHSTRVENGCVYWTDNLNEPRRIDINAGLALNGGAPGYTPYSNPISSAVMALIRRQPGLPPLQQKMVQSSPTVASNMIQSEAFLFAYRYTYRNFELSTLSGFSTLANVNSTDQNFNRIDITIPLGEKIDQDVIQIDLVALYMISGIAFVIHSWRTAVAADAAAIAAHNAGTVALQYSFYNSEGGIALDAAYTNKLFDSVPLQAATLEMAKSRAFLGNYTIGYTTPTVTSLNYTLTQSTYTAGSTGTLTGEWFRIAYIDTFSDFFSHLVIRTTFPVHSTDPTHAYYYYTWILESTIPPYPSSLNAAELIYQGYDLNSVVGNLVNYYHENIRGSIILRTSTDQGQSSVVNPGGTSSSSLLGKGFKSFSTAQLSISFKDYAGRECGILTNPNLIVQFPAAHATTDGTQYTFINAIDWSLNNASALAEIPSWANYYSVNITKCLRTRFFIQCLGAVVYAARDASNNYTFTTTAYASNLAGVAVDITLLQSTSMGYVFAQGDVARLFVNGAYYNLTITGQQAQYIICTLTNVGSLISTIGQLEIYTPYKRQSNEPYFEQSQIFSVANPGTNSRTYGTTSGVISGDIYILQRTDGPASYITETMSPNDKYYLNWFTDAGRPNFVDNIGQVVKPTSIAYSNTFIAGSQNNGLSTFDALDTQDISPDFGGISKLQLASKVSKIGTVMLAICAGPTTASLYLGENTLLTQTGDSILGQSNTVIGSIHELKGNFGTLNPESVVEFRGNIYWFDVQNGMVIQYADNGLFPISNYKLSRFWKLFADQYKSMSTAAIEALGSRPFVFGTADPHHGEILFSVPRVLSVPPNGTLPDYPSVNWPFDIWDGQGKTLVYKLYTDPNHWQGSYSYQPDYLFNLEDNLFSLQNGQLYLHNQTNYCNFYGVQYNPTVMGVCNQQTNLPKVYNTFSAEANALPSWVYFYAAYPYSQVSDVLDYQFSNKEGVWYTTIYRNKLDPQFGGQYAQALLSGERLRTTALYYMAQWNGGTLIQVKFLNVGYTVSLGQKITSPG